MDRLLKYLIIFLIFAGQNSLVSKTTILVECEGFKNTGGWVIDQQFMNVMGSPFLLAHGLGGPVDDAVTTVKFQEKGKYKVWVRTRDWVGYWKTLNTPESKKAYSSPGKFQMQVNGRTLNTVFGVSGADWHWQYGGEIQIDQHEAEVKLIDLTGFDGRADAFIFSNEKDFKPPENIEEINKLRIKSGALSEIKDAGDYDLVVVGGGIAGMCASISGARQGLKTALIQNRPVLGGNNSSEVRVWLNGRSGFEPYTHIGDIVNELEPAQRAHYGAGNKGELYEDEKRIALIKSEKNISLFLNFHANAVEKEGDRIKAVTAQNIRTGERLRFSGRWFSDCTGHGSIGFLAGADFDMTMKGHMGRSNLFNIVDSGSPSSFPECPWALDLSDKPFPGRPKNPGTNGNAGLDALGTWFWESGFDHDPIKDGEYIRDWNFRAIFGVWNCLKNVDKEYPNHELNWAAYISGTRESRRLLGDIILSGEDFLTGKKYKDGCVPTSWSQDLHLPRKQYVKGFEGDAFISIDIHKQYKVPYWIPYRCLYSRNIPNLFMAGRDISVTHEGLGPVRVMRTCGMMGEIVGVAAAICKKYQIDPRQVYENHLDELFIPPPQVLIQPNGATFLDSLTINLDTDSDKNRIYYTTDGTMPNINSMLYNNPFRISKPVQIKAYAVE